MICAPEDCDRCPLINSCIQVVNSYGPTRKGTPVFVGIGPGKHEDRQGKPFRGDSGYLLYYLARNSGLNIRDFRLSNCIRCRPPKNREPLKSELAACVPYLLEELDELEPSAIITLGATPWQQLSGHNTGVRTARGTHYWTDRWNCPIIPTVHPSAALHSWQNVPILEYDLRYARKVLTGELEDPKPWRTYTLLTVDHVRKFRDYVLSGRVDNLTFDIETTGLNPRVDRILCIAFSPHPDYAYCVPILQQFEADYWSEGDYAEVWEYLRQILESRVPKSAQNGYFDISFCLHRLGIEVQNYTYDLMLSHHLLNENLPHNAEFIAGFYTDVAPWKGMLDQWVPNKNTPGAFAKAPNEVLWEYCGIDTIAENRGRVVLQSMMSEQDESLHWVWDNITMPLAPILRKFEDRGIAVDVDRVREIGAKLKEEQKTPEAELYKAVGHDFNWRSPKQLPKIMFGELGLPVVKETKKGAPSTDKEACEKLWDAHPMVPRLIQCRQLDKLITTYLDGRDGQSGILKNVEWDDRTQTHRFFPGVLQTGTVTGRLSSSPNYHNIPRKRDGWDFNLRNIFVASPGMINVGGDASQIELRFAGVHSREPFYLDGFRSGPDFDPHRMIASELLGKPPDQVTKWERSLYKTINFGILYGMSAKALAMHLTLDGNPTDVDTAAEYIERYFERMPYLHRWIREQQRSAFESGYVTNLFGRVRRLVGLRCDDEGHEFESQSAIRSEIARQAVNSPIQGGASDAIHLACIRLDERIQQDGFNAHLTLHLHDHLNYELPIDEARDFAFAFKEEFEKQPHPQFDVPLLCDIYAADCWEGPNRIREFAPELA